VEGVLCVEDWAEIRRLHRAEKMPIKVIAPEPVNLNEARLGGFY
jgi:hypothetical protein